MLSNGGVYNVLYRVMGGGNGPGCTMIKVNLGVRGRRFPRRVVCATTDVNSGCRNRLSRGRVTISVMGGLSHCVVHHSTLGTRGANRVVGELGVCSTSLNRVIEIVAPSDRCSTGILSVTPSNNLMVLSSNRAGAVASKRVMRVQWF